MSTSVIEIFQQGRIRQRVRRPDDRVESCAEGETARLPRFRLDTGRLEGRLISLQSFPSRPSLRSDSTEPAPPTPCESSGSPSRRNFSHEQYKEIDPHAGAGVRSGHAGRQRLAPRSHRVRYRSPWPSLWSLHPSDRASPEEKWRNP